MKSKRFVNALTARVSDPALEKHYRAIALVQSEPDSDTESCDGCTEQDYLRLFGWLKSAFGSGQSRPVWERRLALRYKLGQHDATREPWFWINALPALAGLNLGLKEHPFLAVCAGYAHQTVDDRDVGQMTVMNQINREFFQ